MDRNGGKGSEPPGGDGPPAVGSCRDRGVSAARGRGVSEVTGLILLFGIVMAGVALILLTSTAVQDGIQQQNRMDSAEVTMTELDSELGTLSYEDSANVTAFEFSDTERGQIDVRRDDTKVSFTLNEDPRCSASVELGAIEYVENDDERVAYEGGGVWRISGGEPVMVQPPDLQFRNGTVTFAAQNVTGRVANTSAVVADKDFERSRELTEAFERDLLTGPAGDPEPCMLRNNLTITVRSPYYEAWAEFLDQEIEPGVVTVDDANETVSVFVRESDLNGFDSDGDGIIDETDNCPAEFNPRQLDTDDNGDGDVCDPDDDGDRVADDKDNCQKRDNPKQRDADGDGVGDTCDPDLDGDSVPNIEDNCFKDYNPSQDDIDGDGAGNACDPDMDGDGVANTADNCPTTPNPSQSDIDGGGRGDACDSDMDGDDTVDRKDNCPATPNRGQNDSDGDGVGDACEDIDEQDYDGDGIDNGGDNCPLTDNPDQRNTDRDEYGGGDNPRGDACDADDDGDGAFDGEDNCQRTWNPRQLDTDGNGVGDACDPDDDGDGDLDGDDNCPRTYNPSQKDADRDGVGDACERDETAIPDHDETFVDVAGVDATAYREVTVYVTVDTEDGRSGDLTEEDFLVYEDYEPRNVTSVEDSERSTVDVVFVVDETASMNGSVDTLRSNVRNFTDGVGAAGISARYGLVTVNDTVTYDQKPVLDVGEFERAVDAVDPPNRTDRRPAGLDGVYAAVNRTDWRDDAQKVVVYVADDPAESNRSVRETATALNDEGITFYAVSPPARRGAGKPPARQVVDAVEGQWLNVRSAGGLDPFLEDVESDLRTRYAVTFESCKAADGSGRELAILANDTDGTVGRGNTTYIAPDRDLEDDCEIEGPPEYDPNPAPDTPLPDVPGEAARNASDDDPDIVIKRPQCDPTETPVGDNDKYDDASAVPDPNSDGTKGCYPSEIPTYGPGDPPEPYTNVINVNVDYVRIEDANS